MHQQRHPQREHKYTHYPHTHTRTHPHRSIAPIGGAQSPTLASTSKGMHQQRHPKREHKYTHFLHTHTRTHACTPLPINCTHGRRAVPHLGIPQRHESAKAPTKRAQIHTLSAHTHTHAHTPTDQLHPWEARSPPLRHPPKACTSKGTHKGAKIPWKARRFPPWGPGHWPQSSAGARPRCEYPGCGRPRSMWPPSHLHMRKITHACMCVANEPPAHEHVRARAHVHACRCLHAPARANVCVHVCLVACVGACVCKRASCEFACAGIGLRACVPVCL